MRNGRIQCASELLFLQFIQMTEAVFFLAQLGRREISPSEKRLRTPGVSPGVKAASRRLVKICEGKVCYR